MSPSRGEKRKRSLSPAKSKSPEAKKGKFGQLLSFLTPSKSGKDADDRKKKRLSFGAPVVHAFDAFSPPCRRRPLHDNCAIDAQDMEKGVLACCLLSVLCSRPIPVVALLQQAAEVLEGVS